MSQRWPVGAGLLAIALLLAGCATGLGSASAPAEPDWPMVPSAGTPSRPTKPREPAPAPADIPMAEEDRYWADESALPVLAPMPGELLTRLRAGFSLPASADPSIRQELATYAKSKTYLDRVFGRSERYLYHVVTEVEARGLPMELALLPVVESAYNPYAYSGGRAAGIWQFIPGTAARYSLKQNWWQDQRRDVVASTAAALDYLQKLNAIFDGDWLLTIAAYNTGEMAVQRAMRRNRAAGLPTDFWHLQLPAETRVYVPRLMAIRELVMNPEQYGITLPAIADAPYFRRVETGGQIDLRVAAQLAGISTEELHALNPGYNRWATDPSGPHVLYVPVDVADTFATAVAGLGAAQRLSLANHVVAEGDTLSSVARDYKVAVEALRALNPGAPARPAVGEVLRVPVDAGSPLRAGLVVEGEPRAAAAGKPSAKGTGARKIHYRVRAGDTLYGLAQRFSVAVADLRRWNRLQGSLLKAGQRLVIHLPAGSPRG